MAKRRGKASKAKERPLKDPVSNTGVMKRSFKKRKKFKKPNATSNPNVGQSSSKPDLVSAPTHASTSTLVPLGNDQSKQNAEKKKHGSGFIFMCSGQTKPECYKYRVFGLPKGKIEVVKNINPNMKLFLFDIDTKLLYGIYQATTKGALDIEPMAFNGQFQAQVRFKVFKDCLPLPESVFKHAIKDNYDGGRKFRQELSSIQVKNLISLFHPIAKRPSTHNAHLRPNVAIQQSFGPTRTKQLAQSFPLENSSSSVHYLPILETRSQHAVQHGEYDPFEPAAHVTHSQEHRHVRIDAPSRRLEPYHLGLVHEPYLTEKSSLSQDSCRRNGNQVQMNHVDRRVMYGHQSRVLQSVTDPVNVPHFDHTSGYYRQHMSPGTTLIAPRSQGGLSGPPRHGLSYSYHSYYNAVASRDAYGGSPQRQVSGIYGYMDSNLPMSSYYSSAAARSSYR